MTAVNRVWWHIIWTTFRTRSPADVRGDWSELSKVYADLGQRFGSIEMATPLDVRWQGKPEEEGSLALSPHAREVAERSIRELAASDRVAGETEIRAIAVDANSVQVVLACPADELHQRVGRLKSRSATLLSFDPAIGIPGKGTWSRGFWWARLTDERAVAAVADFVHRRTISQQLKTS